MSKTEEETTEPLNKKPRLNESPFNDLPGEVLLFILRYLDSPDLLNCRAVSRTWSDLSSVLLHSRKSRDDSTIDDRAESQTNIPPFKKLRSKGWLREKRVFTSYQTKFFFTFLPSLILIPLSCFSEARSASYGTTCPGTLCGRLNP